MRRKREYSDFVRDMLVYAEKAERFAADMDLASFQADERTNMAVTRALEVVGEAARHVPPAVRRRYPDVPWRKIIGIRNIVIHDYPAVDLEVIWLAIRQGPTSTAGDPCAHAGKDRAAGWRRLNTHPFATGVAAEHTQVPPAPGKPPAKRLCPSTPPTWPSAPASLPNQSPAGCLLWPRDSPAPRLRQ